MQIAKYFKLPAFRQSSMLISNSPPPLIAPALLTRISTDPVVSAQAFRTPSTAKSAGMVCTSAAPFLVHSSATSSSCFSDLAARKSLSPCWAKSMRTCPANTPRSAGYQNLRGVFSAITISNPLDTANSDYKLGRIFTCTHPVYRAELNRTGNRNLSRPLVLVCHPAYLMKSGMFHQLKE